MCFYFLAYIFFNVHNMIKDLFKKHISSQTYISTIAFLNKYVFLFHSNMYRNYKKQNSLFKKLCRFECLVHNFAITLMKSKIFFGFCILDTKSSYT